ncbi:MAG TPA: protein phosphatase 2C domain-containing protein, partial [Longimicrobiaceae bacterium]|nr:protein phosphatase 2C domain-containing protein [Longimicrobiaceae bacterium]
PERVVAAQVGDGAVVVRGRDGSLHAADAAAHAGEYLNETVFLTSPGALDALAPTEWEEAPSHLALLTDGLQLLALRMPRGTPHPPFFEPLFRFVAEEPDPGRASERLRAYLAGPRVAARADDDLTLLLAALG